MVCPPIKHSKQSCQNGGLVGGKDSLFLVYLVYNVIFTGAFCFGDGDMLERCLSRERITF